MIIILTGGTGLIGQAVLKELVKKNHTLHLLSRKKTSPSCKLFLWPNVKDPLPPKAFPIKEKYGVLHLAGEPVSTWPWTKKTKEKIYSSRIEGTKNLINTIKTLPQTPEWFISAGATGIYGEQQDQTMTETSSIKDQNLFLQKVCKDWEREAFKISELCRTCVFRFGMVLSNKKGFLYEQLKLMKKGIGFNFFSKKETWLSWISLNDLTRMLLWAIENHKVQGLYNATAPQAVTFKEFYQTLRRLAPYKTIPIPTSINLMKFFGGQMMKNLLMSHKVFPEKALKEGFSFQEKDLKSALRNI